MSSIRILAAGAIASVFGLMSVTASAASVTQCGPTVCYTYDDAQAAVALYGTPTLSGDSLVFLPTNFRAESDNTTGTADSDVVGANFVFDNIYSLNGVTEIAEIQVTEFFDYDIIDGDSVRADLRLTGVNIGGIPEIQSTLATFETTGDSGGQQATTLTNTFDAANLFEGSAQSIGLSLQNTLTAQTDALGEEAWIQKKAQVTITALVPIPAAVWLFGSGLVGLFAWGRRRA